MVISRTRVSLAYLWRHRRLPRLGAPTLFTELVQHRKLHDWDARFGSLIDKVRVKVWVAEQLGPDWVIPTLWHGTELPNKPAWPTPFVVKASHGCNQYAFVRTGTESWSRIRRRARRWTRRGYGRWLDEWAYRDLRPGLLVEPFIGQNGVLPVDYKLYVFGGRVAFVQVHLERERARRWFLFDRDWQRVSKETAEPDPPMPNSLAAIIDAAERLGRDFPFVRVDLYEVDQGPRFGEMTFYPGSGLDPFAPVSLDARLGRLWLAALGNERGYRHSSKSDAAANPVPRPL